MTLDLMTLINTIFGFIILILGFIGYKRGEDVWPLLIGIAFGIFGVSHLLTLLDLKETLATFLLAIRIIAYLLVALTVSRIGYNMASSNPI